VDEGRDLRIISAAVGISALGDWLALAPLALELQEMTGSGVQVALLFIAIWSPAVLLAAPAGLMVDRLDNRRLLLVVSCAQAVVAASLAFAGSVPVILALAAVLGVGYAVGQPAEFALVPLVAGESRLRQANASVETARYVGFTAGPLAGGILAATGGVKVALLVNAASYLVVAGAALVLRPRPRPRTSGGEERVRALDGVRYLFADRTLALVMAVAFVSLLFMTASATAEVFFAKDVLDAGDVGYGALLSAWTVGMAAGALVLSKQVKVGLAAGALIAIAVQGLGLALPTLWLVLVFALGSYAIGGAAHGLKNVLVRTLMHERVPERLHGRAYAAYNGLRNGAELVALAAGGVLVSAAGARATLFVAGFLPALAGIAGVAILGRRSGGGIRGLLRPEPELS
jgi:Na+/melibiose symporter-like transporter